MMLHYCINLNSSISILCNIILLLDYVSEADIVLFAPLYLSDILNYELLYTGSPDVSLLNVCELNKQFEKPSRIS